MAAMNGTERYVNVFSSAVHVLNHKTYVFGAFLMLDYYEVFFVSKKYVFRARKLSSS